MTGPEFVEFPKIPRLSRDCVVTEKIDGTNGQIYIPPPDDDCPYQLLVGSRNRWLTPDSDNHGFCRWAFEHLAELLELGPGHHFGEWWGHKINRGYGLTEKRFSLFNVERWGAARDREKFPSDPPACCHVVPVLYRGPFMTSAIEDVLTVMRGMGSTAAPGFMKPEGIVVWHSAAGVLFKKTIEHDEMPKTVAPGRRGARA